MPPSPAPPKLLEAISLAARVHGGQKRKDGLTPYIAHPFRVCQLIQEAFDIHDPDILTAAILHDVIEDTTTDFDDLSAQFGETVARWVALLSKDKRLPEEEREAAYIEQLCQSEWPVIVCKLADMLDNLIDSRGLSAEQARKVVTRVRFYVDQLAQTVPVEAERAFAIVHDELIAQEQRLL